MQSGANDIHSFSARDPFDYNARRALGRDATKKLCYRIQPEEYPIDPLDPTLWLNTHTGWLERRGSSWT